MPIESPDLSIPVEIRRLAALEFPLAQDYDDLARQLANVIAEASRDAEADMARQTAREARHALAQSLLCMPDDRIEAAYLAGLGKLHSLLAGPELKLEAPSEAEGGLVEGLRDAATSPRRLLAAMLYFQPDELTMPFDVPALPGWLLPQYLRFVHELPPLFNATGASERYGNFVRRWVEYVYTNYTGKRDSELWRNVAMQFVQAGNFIPLYFNRQELHEIHRQRAAILETVLASLGHTLDHTFPPRPAGRRIKVGIVNAHFATQTETFHTIPAFEHLDREKFDVTLYALQRGGDPTEAYCRGRAERFVELPRELPAQVAALRREDLDVLITGSNVTAVTNAMLLLLAHRVARVQCTLFGSPTSTGLRNMDVYISGELSEPAEGAEGHYSEKLVKLEGPGFCFTYPPLPTPPLPVVTREALGIPADTVVFASGANFYKITPELEAVWLRVLAAVPGSVLLLYPFSPSWSNAYPVNTFMRRLATDMAALDLDISRLVVLPGLNGREEVKSYLRVADVYLDSFPHSGSHSLYDPLELGIPAVAMDGANLRAKHGGAMLRDMGLGEWVAGDEAAYVEAARRLGTDAGLREKVGGQVRAALAKPARFIDSRFYSGAIGKMIEWLLS